MTRLPVALLCWSFMTIMASAGSVSMIENAPTSYVPGQPITFSIRLPPITNLGAYNIDIVVESLSGEAGVDFSFDLDGTMPSTNNYVFPSSLDYFDAVNTDSLTSQRLTLSDFYFAGVDVSAGVNDLVALVVLLTAPEFSGELSLVIDPASLILDMPGLTPTPVPQFASIQADVATAMAVVVRAVPEPTAYLLLLTVASVGIHLARRGSKLVRSHANEL